MIKFKKRNFLLRDRILESLMGFIGLIVLEYPNDDICILM